MDSKNHILIAEDDQTLLDVLQSMLSTTFHISTAENGNDALEKINSKDFLFVVLDIHLPGMTGLEICEAIQTLPDAKRPNVVILSGDANPETIRRAYDLNVDDYILKPVNGLNFVQRMKTLERDLVYLHTLKNEQGLAKDMADTAMSQAAGYGGAFELISRLNSCATPQSVADALIAYMKNNGHFVAVEVRGFEQPIRQDADTGNCSDVETKIFEVLHNQGRIYGFGKRCIFNDSLISILVKNMPQAGSKEYDLLVDVAAKLVPAIDNRLQALRNEVTLRQTTNLLKDALSMFAEGVTNMQSKKQQLLHDLENKVSEGFNQLGMSEEQERYFIELVENMVDENAADTNFERLNDLLVGCHSNITRCLEQNKPAPQEQEADSDIELF